ncbi:MAG TPA: sugar ABC transporter permease, partial [Phototrophicaceae bacterium]|nr:sugar ABC transporter permease [Phototrophicaceae bacterium]
MLPNDTILLLITLIPLILGAFYLGQQTAQRGGSLLVGAAAGGVAAVIGARLLLIPLNYCTFDPEGPAVDMYFGFLLVGIGAVVGLGIAQILIQVLFSGKGWGALVAGQSSTGTFRGTLLPWLLLAPTLIILLLFLYYPALDNFRLSTLLARLGTSRTAFVCVKNFTRLLEPDGFTTSLLLPIAGCIAALIVFRVMKNRQLLIRYAAGLAGIYFLLGVVLAQILESDYYHIVMTTLGISFAVVAIGLVTSLGIAYMAYQPIRGAGVYRTLLIWPYAISPPVAGIIFALLFNPTAGIVNHVIEQFGGTGLPWLQDARLAPWTIIIASVWKSLGFSILFYIAGLQNVSKDLVEAASIDGANAWQRFIRIVVPMLSPITFFLVITNITYAFFETFGTIDFLTRGGPAGATTTMIYNIYQTGIIEVDL